MALLEIVELPAAALPPLESGDRLTRREFERRYATMSQIKKTELIEGADGLVRSQVFPGLHLAVAALLAGDLAQGLAAVQASLAIEEHAAFVARLAAAR